MLSHQRLNEVEKYKIDPSAWNKQDIMSLDKESQRLIKHKCEYKLGKDGVNVTFVPSPHLYDKDGKYDSEKDPMHEKEKKYHGHVCQLMIFVVNARQDCGFAFVGSRVSPVLRLYLNQSAPFGCTFDLNCFIFN